MILISIKECPLLFFIFYFIRFILQEPFSQSTKCFAATPLFFCIKIAPKSRKLSLEMIKNSLAQKKFSKIVIWNNSNSNLYNLLIPISIKECPWLFFIFYFIRFIIQDLFSQSTKCFAATPFFFCIKIAPKSRKLSLEIIKNSLTQKKVAKIVIGNNKKLFSSEKILENCHLE